MGRREGQTRVVEDDKGAIEKEEGEGNLRYRVRVTQVMTGIVEID
jgi:hypothetical protein